MGWDGMGLFLYLYDVNFHHSFRYEGGYDMIWCGVGWAGGVGFELFGWVPSVSKASFYESWG